MPFSSRNLEEGIKSIGNRMVACTLNCDGVDLVPAEGKIPRALHLEMDAGSSGRGVIVVGLNPGRAAASERAYFKNVGRTFEHAIEYWNTNAPTHPYHVRLKALVLAWGFTGPILWSELAKCQSKENVQALPLQTFRTCVGEFLREEVSLTPQDWLILAAGRESYKAMSYLFSDRTVVGVPHPTGAWLTQNQRLQLDSEEAKSVVSDLCSRSRPAVAWLPDML